MSNKTVPGYKVGQSDSVPTVLNVQFIEGRTAEWKGFVIGHNDC